jgi:hypothetical protein
MNWHEVSKSYQNSLLCYSYVHLQLTKLLERNDIDTSSQQSDNGTLGIKERSADYDDDASSVGARLPVNAELLSVNLDPLCGRTSNECNDSTTCCGFPSWNNVVSTGPGENTFTVSPLRSRSFVSDLLNRAVRDYVANCVWRTLNDDCET